eukprot:7383127-Prymnesium_polylepis.2
MPPSPHQGVHASMSRRAVQRSSRCQQHTMRITHVDPTRTPRCRACATRNGCYSRARRTLLLPAALSVKYGERSCVAVQKDARMAQRWPSASRPARDARMSRARTRRRCGQRA